MDHDTLKRWEDLARRAVIALERLAADAPPLKEGSVPLDSLGEWVDRKEAESRAAKAAAEHRDTKPGNTPGLPPVPPVAHYAPGALCPTFSADRAMEAGLDLDRAVAARPIAPEPKAPSHATKGREDAPHLPPLDGLPTVQKTVVETARAQAAAESKADLVDWDLAKSLAEPAATAQPRPAGVFLRPKRAVEPLSWDGEAKPEETPAERCERLRRRLFSLVREKLGPLGPDASSVEARRVCGVESVRAATDAQLLDGIAVLSTLPAYVAPATPPTLAPEPYTVAAGVARGLSPEDSTTLGALAGDERPPAFLAGLAQIHSAETFRVARKAAGVELGKKAKDTHQARRLVMALPVVVQKEPEAEPLTRAETLARKLGGGPRAVALGAELAAAETARSKGSHAGGFAQAAAELLRERLGIGWDALARKHEALWDADPTLGGVLALVDDAPVGVTT